MGRSDGLGAVTGNQQPAGVVLDLDRTLLDVQERTDYARALTDVRRLVGTWPDVTIPETSWNGPMRTCLAVLVALGDDPRWHRVSETVALYELAAVADSRARPGAAALLERLRGRQVAVVSLLPERAARAALARHGLEVEVVVGRRPDLRPPPAPDQILRAARLVSLDPSQLVMVGTAEWDGEAARNAGAGFVAVAAAGEVVHGPGTVTIADLGDLATSMLLTGG